MSSPFPTEVREHLDYLADYFHTCKRDVLAPIQKSKKQWKEACQLALGIFQSHFLKWADSIGECHPPKEFIISQLARLLLVPPNGFSQTAKMCGYDLISLGKQYSGVPPEILASRLLDLNYPCVISVMENGHLVSRESNFNFKSKGLFSLEERVWRNCHESGRVKKESENGWVVYAWPVHGVDWKKEILRTVVPEEDNGSCFS